ncbi:hypothetical protein MMC17_000311 [Xylographa soralifera]|nr:hypothetical protein [Xylographa soralifera]
MSLLFQLIHARLFCPHDPTVTFEGKHIIVTGSNSGIGYDAALKLVKLRAATVILAVRSINRGMKAKSDIERLTNRFGVVQIWELDMNSYASIRSFAERAEAELPSLDVAVLNAGVVCQSFRLSQEGWEETLQVNVLSTALLAMLLLPQMKASKTKSSTAHLCVVGSGMHEFAKVDEIQAAPKVLEAMNQSNSYAGAEAQYNITKLFVQYVVSELASRLVAPDGEPQVIINTASPGATATKLIRDVDGVLLRILVVLYLWLLTRTSEQGSRSLVSAVTLGKESHGLFWQHDKLTA